MGLKGYVTLFAIFEKAKPFFFLHQFNSKNNGPVLLFKTLFRHRKSFLLSNATNDADGFGLELENVGATFLSFNDMPSKITQKYNIMVSAP